jgi:hypothetical protein
MQCFTIGQSNQSITGWKGGLDEGAKAVALWFGSISRYFFGVVCKPGKSAAAKVDGGKSQCLDRERSRF